MTLLERWWRPRVAGFAALLLCMGWCAQAASPDRMVRVGLLLSGFAPQYVEAERAFIDGMREAGYVEGRNLVVERRYGHLQYSNMVGIARELSAMNLDAIVTGCTGSTRAAQLATTTTPIVMASVADPVGQGFAKSLAQSGANVTGQSSQSRELLPKMLELLLAAVPKAERIAVLVQTRNTVHETLWNDVVAAAGPLRVSLVRIEMDGAAGLDAALEKLARSRVQAVLALPDDPPMLNLRPRVVAAANALRLPSFYSLREFVVDGGLMSYGERFPDGYRRAAAYVDKVVRGAKPSDLPIEQPRQFELVINLKTARALGLEVPRALLLRADETIR
jgi:putative ABC transport system substrate-binding protein